MRNAIEAALITAALTACGGSSGSPPPPDPEPQTLELAITADASVRTGSLAPLWRDHYDLSLTHFDYLDEAGFGALAAELQPRSWRCSIGRWEVGFPPPAGGDSLDPVTLRGVEREFYRGANTMSAADDPANYDFTYLGLQLQELLSIGAAPLLCFDYMPITLSLEQDPNNRFNYNITEPRSPFSRLSFSNGIRTAPPQDPAVYARVVRNTIRHVRGLFAGTTDFGVRDFEIGNEPDIFDSMAQRTGVFWTGDRSQWLAMYTAIANEVDNDPEIRSLVRLGGGSFAFSPAEIQPTFAADVIAGIATNAARLDFLSFHSYSDELNYHLNRFVTIQAIRNANGLTSELVNGEWGRALRGQDPVYDGIGHGLFRTKAMMLMQVFGITQAHEAIYRDPGTSGGELGLTRTQPPAHKPASLCCKALNALNGATDALEITAPTGVFAICGGRPTDDVVAVAVAIDEPAAGTRTGANLRVDNLPWGSAQYRLRLLRVIESSTDVETVGDTILAGATLTTGANVESGQSGVYIWLLERQ